MCTCTYSFNPENGPMSSIHIQQHIHTHIYIHKLAQDHIANSSRGRIWM